MSTVYFFAVMYENHKRERLMAQGKEVTVEEEERLGDLACTYRYAY
jgi:hypothetical protein